MKYFLALPIAALTLLASASPACATPFGVASAYNVVALTGNINDQSEILGRAAAAGSINAVQVGLGTILNDPYGTANTFAFVANGGYTGQNQVQVGGNAYSPGNTSSQFNFSKGGALLNTTAPINFSSLASSIDTESLALGALASTGSVNFDKNANPQLTLTGLSSTLNIFTVTADQLNVTDMNIVAPAGSTIIINVTGGTGSAINVPKLSYNGVQVSGDSAADDNILFNFYQDTTTVNFTGQFSASVLAPLADITGDSQLDGTIIAGSFDDRGEIHNVEFTGNIPLTSGNTPEPSSFVLLATGAAGMLGAIRRRLR